MQMQSVLAVTPEKKVQLDALCDQYELKPGHGSARASPTIWDWYTLPPDIMPYQNYAVYLPILSTCAILDIDIDTSLPNPP